MTRPVLPRVSSATSGFFFCGMSELPVVKASLIVMNSNSLEAHRITSSLSRERCTATSARAASSSTAKSRSLTASMQFCVTAGKPSSRATSSRSSRMVEPAIAPEPSGQTLMRLRASAQPLAVAVEHLDVGEQMMREIDGLRALEMRVAGNDDVAMPRAEIDERALHFREAARSRSSHASRR